MGPSCLSAHFIYLFTGIPGIHAVPLRPTHGRDYLKLRTENAARAWDHARAAKPDYGKDLPKERIKLKKK